MSIEKALSGKGKKKLDLDQFMKLAEKDPEVLRFDFELVTSSPCRFIFLHSVSCVIPNALAASDT